MGYLTRLAGLQRAAQPLEVEQLQGGHRGGVASPMGPFMPTQSLAVSALFDVPLGYVGRDAALQLPPVSKGRFEVQKLATIPLITLRGDERLVPPTRWLVSSRYGSPWLRMQATLDDLIFEGASMWQLDRGSRNTILDAAHVSLDEWSINPDGVVELRGQPVTDPLSVLVFVGPLPGGLLTTARHTLQAGIDLEAVWANRVANPAPLVELHQTTEDTLEPAEKTEILSTWNTARRSKTGATAFSPHWLEVKVHGTAQVDLMVAARNQLAVDIGSHLGLPTPATNSSLATASLTYTTQQGTTSQLREALIPWGVAVTSRLSEDDVCPAGQRIGFDIARFDAARGAEEES